jgi:hypothetical protein
MRVSSTPFLLVVLAALCGYFAYVVHEQVIPCVTPVTYSLASLDDRFGISKEEADLDLKKAAAVWNDALGKDALVEAKGAAPELPVSFVYDKTQATVDTLEHLSDDIDTLKQELTDVANQYGTLKSRYDALNAQGHATQDMYDQLQTLYGRYEALRKKINADVAQGTSIPTGSVEEGLYTSDKDGTRITIYAFQDKAELLRTMTHEFGHALGLEHVANSASIMYPSNSDTASLALSREDKAELARVCSAAEQSTLGVLYGYIHKVDMIFARSEIK